MDALQLLFIGTLSVLCSLHLANSTKTGFYFDDHGQEKTVLIDKLSKKKQRIIKEEMLNILGLEKAPKVNKNNKANSAPQYMLDLYKQYAVQAENEISDSIDRYSQSMNVEKPDLVISFMNHARKQKHLRHDKHRTYYFDLSEVPATEAVCQADFRVFKLPADGDVTAQTFNIAVYQLVKDSFDAETRLEMEANISVSSDYKGWLDFNITSAATEWTYFPVTNLGLFMEITDETGAEVDPRDVRLVGKRGAQDLQPFLVAYFRAGKKSSERNRRHIKIERDERPRRDATDVSYIDNPLLPYVAKRTRCEKRALYVSFLDLKWQEWIISPKGYAAFYCQGQCAFPLNSHMNATNHAIVQTLVHMKRASIPEPCCAPTKLSPVSVLYFDERNNVILKNYKSMVVKACGCL